MSGDTDDDDDSTFEASDDGHTTKLPAETPQQMMLILLLIIHPQYMNQTSPKAQRHPTYLKSWESQLMGRP